MTLALIGIAVGIAGALGLTRLIANLLFGVSATDPVTFAAIALLLILVSFLACYLPARRAAKLDPNDRARAELTFMPNPLIELKHVERFYPLAKGQFFYVLRDVNLKIEEGDFVSIMGPSGAGKSSLLHVLGMHDHAWTGEYFFEENAIHAHETECARHAAERADRLRLSAISSAR